jgi:hypothetical protein
MSDVRRCYVAPDWGMALRINAILETEFAGGCRSSALIAMSM